MLDIPLTTPEELLHSGGAPVDQDWEGASPPVRFSFLLGRTDTDLLFGANFPAGLHGVGTSGEFREQLWQGNVFELFVHAAASTQYYELNLSPTGAWWSMLFDGYRKRIANPISSTQLACDVQEVKYKQTGAVILSLPLRQIFQGDLLVAQSAILWDDRERFFARRFAFKSASPNARKQLKRAPDFHLREIAEEWPR